MHASAHLLAGKINEFFDSLNRLGWAALGCRVEDSGLGLRGSGLGLAVPVQLFRIRVYASSINL